MEDVVVDDDVDTDGKDAEEVVAEGAAEDGPEMAGESRPCSGLLHSFSAIRDETPTRPSTTTPAP